jgi:hypothetical protein
MTGSLGTQITREQTGLLEWTRPDEHKHEYENNVTRQHSRPQLLTQSACMPVRPVEFSFVNRRFYASLVCRIVDSHRHAYPDECADACPESRARYGSRSRRIGHSNANYDSFAA